ncbi:MAG TPA: glycosyltransferase family 4 protein [Anaerolineales bacterium]|nr:glycosyltransferase family 4 protein [Anaerolineales bacterium]
MMDKRKRIAFIRPKAWPLANRIVDGVIQQQFPDYAVDVIDISTLIRKRPDIVLVNSIVTALLYGKDIAQRRKKFRLAFWRTPYIFRQVRQLLRKIICAGEYVFSFQMQSLFDTSTPGTPHFIYTDHTHLENLNYTASRDNLYSSKWIALEREVYQHASLIFVRSTNVLRSVIEEYGQPRDKVVCVYAGSNANVHSEKRENSDYTKPEILFVGLDWRRKGGPDLVQAFQEVRDKCPEAHLTIVGARPDIHLPNCDVIGPVQPDELDSYYQRASVFCLPTHMEPFGIVFIEAMTAHLPIVATRVGAIPDFVEDGKNGWLVPPGDVPGLASALLKLLQDPELCRSFGEESFRLTKERYSWTAVGEKFRQSILNVLTQSFEGE